MIAKKLTGGRPIVKADLDLIKCDNPACTSDDCLLQLCPPCHRSAAVKAFYSARWGALELYCGECGKPVARVAVAAGLPQ